MTKLARSLAKTFANAGIEIGNSQIQTETEEVQDYWNKALTTLKEIRGFGTVTTDIELFEKIKKLAKESELGLGNDFWRIYNKTIHWNHVGGIVV